MKVALPFDGSPSAARALHYIIKLAAATREPLKVDLINVQASASGIPESFVRDAAEVAAQLVLSARETGMKVLAKPIAALKKAKLLNESTVLIGDTASVIAEYVEDNGCEAIIMGTRGLGPIGGLVMGSVAGKIIHLVKVPVTLVK